MTNKMPVSTKKWAATLFPFQGGGWLRGSGSAADQQEVFALTDLPAAGSAHVPRGGECHQGPQSGSAEQTIPVCAWSPAQPLWIWVPLPQRVAQEPALPCRGELKLEFIFWKLPQALVYLSRRGRGDCAWSFFFHSCTKKKATTTTMAATPPVVVVRSGWGWPGFTSLPATCAPCSIPTITTRSSWLISRGLITNLQAPALNHVPTDTVAPMSCSAPFHRWELMSLLLLQ